MQYILLTIALLSTNITSIDIVDSRLQTTLASLNHLVQPQYIQQNLKIRLVHPCNLFQQVRLQIIKNLDWSSLLNEDDLQGDQGTLQLRYPVLHNDYQLVELWTNFGSWFANETMSMLLIFVGRRAIVNSMYCISLHWTLVQIQGFCPMNLF